MPGSHIIKSWKYIQDLGEVSYECSSRPCARIPTEGARVCAMSLRWVNNGGAPDVKVKADVLSIHGLEVVELPHHKLGPFRAAILSSGAHGCLVPFDATMHTEDGGLRHVLKRVGGDFWVRHIAGRLGKGAGVATECICREQARRGHT